MVCQRFAKLLRYTPRSGSFPCPGVSIEVSEWLASSLSHPPHLLFRTGQRLSVLTNELSTPAGPGCQSGHRGRLPGTRASPACFGKAPAGPPNLLPRQARLGNSDMDLAAVLLPLHLLITPLGQALKLREPRQAAPGPAHLPAPLARRQLPPCPGTALKQREAPLPVSVCGVLARMPLRPGKPRAPSWGASPLGPCWAHCRSDGMEEVTLAVCVAL